ncbi:MULTISPECIES: phage holin family protein [Massilia]|uniref:Phage holin family protein n=2 Tax=Massilia TaxID=149698 RepID=A0ABY4A079_9BURK|nr:MULTISPECIES: phage holin family protein [Massilia]NHZ42016.1 phage holin family protein [Massilia aquatica]UOD28096.1 phage holin family protein [Massilia violaceinigra]
MDKTTAAVHGPGLMGGLTGLAKNVFGLVVSRVELAALELSEVRNHVLELLVVFSLAVLCAMFALAYGSATIVALAWESMGWKILLIMFAVFIAVTIGLVLKAKAMLKEGKLAFPETMNELKNDRDMLL